MSQWFYEYNGSSEGPVSERDILRLIEDGVITAKTGLWRQGMGDWQPAASVSPFSDEFQQPPPLPEDQSYSTKPPPMSSSESDSFHTGTGRQSAPQREPDIPTNMTKAILSTIFCCLPLGVVAIVKASGVSSAMRRGDYEEARRLSDEASTWSGWSIGLGLVVGIIYFIANIAADI